MRSLIDAASVAMRESLGAECCEIPLTPARNILQILADLQIGDTRTAGQDGVLPLTEVAGRAARHVECVKALTFARNCIHFHTCLERIAMSS
jgi:hypothetical protein